MKVRVLGFLCFFLTISLYGCDLRPPVVIAPDSETAQPFIPPASITTAVSETQPGDEPGPVQPTPTLPCQDSLIFVSDLTIPDASEVQPGASLDKRWEVRNNGSCGWDKGYSIRLIAGDALGLPVEQPLFPARSETTLMIRMIFKAPEEPGSYRSAWQAHNPQGEPFGDPIYIDIIVTEP